MGSLKVSLPEELATLAIFREEIVQILAENNKKLFTILSLQLNSHRDLHNFLAKTRELSEELSLAEMNAKLLEIFQDKFREQGVLSEPVPKPRRLNLVLDLDETLIHYQDEEDNAKVSLRPFLSEFLEEAAASFDLFVYTSAVKEYADTVISAIDPSSRLFKAVFCRGDLLREAGESFKDLAHVGLDLRRTIIIDNAEHNFTKQKSNGILIQSYLGDSDDTCLKDLLPLLKNIRDHDPDDVREFLDRYKQKLVDNIGRGSVTLNFT